MIIRKCEYLYFVFFINIYNFNRIFIYLKLKNLIANPIYFLNSLKLENMLREKTIVTLPATVINI